MKSSLLGILISVSSLAAVAWPGHEMSRFREVSIHVGRGPKWVSVADVNHDGILDLLVANADDGTVSVLLGEKTQKFIEAQGSPFPAGHLPNDIAIADMNGDGNSDLIIANHQSPNITILLGDGRGVFRSAAGSPIDVHSRPHPHGVAVADFNGDGKADVVTDSWGTNQIELLLGDGSGGLSAPGHYFAVGKRPYQRLRTADFNQDGLHDVITTNLDDGTVSVLLGDGKAGFHGSPGSPFIVDTKPWEIAIADINADGYLDLITIPYQPEMTHITQNAAMVLLGDGKGNFHRLQSSPLSLTGCDGADSVTTGDLEGNGQEAVIVSCAKSKNLMIFERNPDGSFRKSSSPARGGWGSVTAGHLTAGKRDSLITANNDDGTITIFFPR